MRDREQTDRKVLRNKDKQHTDIGRHSEGERERERERERETDRQTDRQRQQTDRTRTNDGTPGAQQESIAP